MPKGTRKKILAAALEMFSENGYAGTNMRELMASIGYAKSSTYRHFGSKEELWNSLLDEMSAYYETHFGSPERLPPVPDTPEELVSMTMRMAAFTIHDRKVVMTRKLLTIEQFRDDRAKALATKHFLTGLSENVFPDFLRNDGQGTAPQGGSLHAGFRLHYPDFRTDPPVRPGAGKNRQRACAD